MLDSGSPISLIKISYVPVYARTALQENENEFRGINGSQLNVLGIFYRDVEIEDIYLKIKFCIVSDDTMAFMAILGRDFSTHSSICITLGDEVTISKKTS